MEKAGIPAGFWAAKEGLRRFSNWYLKDLCDTSTHALVSQPAAGYDGG